MTKFAPLAARVLKERPGQPEYRRAGLIAKLFRVAQARSEARDRSNRASVLRQDDWIDKFLPGVG